MTVSYTVTKDNSAGSNTFTLTNYDKKTQEKTNIFQFEEANEVGIGVGDRVLASSAEGIFGFGAESSAIQEIIKSPDGKMYTVKLEDGSSFEVDQYKYSAVDHIMKKNPPAKTTLNGEMPLDWSKYSKSTDN